MTELVIPNDSNILGNILGGRVMHWMDLAAATAAHKHCNSICVTASIEGMSFPAPDKAGPAGASESQSSFHGTDIAYR